MWKNKHVVVAMLVAPVLAILAWFAVDALVAERPHAAKPGASYELIARSNCRYESGNCDLENSDFKLTLERASAEEGNVLRLTSRFALREAYILIGDEAAELDREPPVELSQDDDSGLEWRMPLAEEPDDGDILRILVVAGQSMYYAETSAIFLTAAER